MLFDFLFNEKNLPVFFLIIIYSSYLNRELNWSQNNRSQSLTVTLPTNMTLDNS